MSKNDINTFQDIVMQAREGVLNHAAMEELPEDRGEECRDCSKIPKGCTLIACPPRLMGAIERALHNSGSRKTEVHFLLNHMWGRLMVVLLKHMNSATFFPGR